MKRAETPDRSWGDDPEPARHGSYSSYQPTATPRLDGPKTSASIGPITEGGQSSSTPGTAEQIALHAAKLVGGDRQRTHGDKVENHEKIARMWSAYLAIRNSGLAEPITALDVAHMMVLLKVARTQAGSHNPDDWTDMTGYSCVAGEIAERAK